MPMFRPASIGTAHYSPTAWAPANRTPRHGTGPSRITAGGARSPGTRLSIARCVSAPCIGSGWLRWWTITQAPNYSPEGHIRALSEPRTSQPILSIIRRRSLAMIRPPVNLKTMSERREWLEQELPIPEDMRQSLAYRTLNDESKIILMLMLDKQREVNHAGS